MKLNFSRGFTLVESLVVISIILLLTSIALVNYRQGEEKFALERAAHKLAQDLRNTLEMAISGKTYGNPPQFPQGGYGIYFPGPDNKSYILFADLNGNKIYDSPLERIETFYLEERGVTIYSFSPGPQLSITFFPPDPTITISSNTGTSSEATIILKQKEATKRVIINKVGLIEIF